ncbi:hypothetical protein SAMN05660489_05848 [Pseudomonas sp. LAMO17WK12:I10]|uniref:hypothetical protein n=1 Tax=Pseudomonas sp. LAMO17WK12:I10 TaxID=1286371 RepID=UPI000BD7CFF4|nr:hypothetical protein [Pseudomonas sp. LAMO17WK12:I10]PXX54018.1 hypothetical protein H160_05841 [Pseudomonas sp. LAMO17WK12:I9]SNY51968.1 hypothetical protein SAMN05660489_05848 [Pseudomonas sp. LAMO17WK12:I10]
MPNGIIPSNAVSLNNYLPATNVDLTAARLDKHTEGKHVMVFSGFSALEYKSPELLNSKLNQILDAAENKYGVNGLLVVAGATTDGIGAVYKIAQERGIATLGIVSERADNGAASISPHCQEVVFVPDPKGSWKVLDAAGASYMTHVARKDGVFHALGGGQVTLSELREAQELGIPTFVMSEFEPDEQRLAVRRQTEPDVDLTPLKTAWQEALSDKCTLKFQLRRGEDTERLAKIAVANEHLRDMAVGERVSKVSFHGKVTISDTFGGDFRESRKPAEEEKISPIEIAYRKYIDKEAKKHEYVDKEAEKHHFTFAEGHTDWKVHSRFDLELAKASRLADEEK